MNSTGKYIADLLYQQDCVILPGFGGFIGNYASAKINSGQHLFSPPHKRIAFNHHLKSNDGLLANHIALSEKISYAEAFLKIENYVTALNENLKKGNPVTLDAIGILSLDFEKNIQFKPGKSNFLIDSFGLSEFQCPAIKPEKISKRIEKISTTENPKIININPLNKQPQSINYKKLIGIAASLTLIAGLFWISIQTDILNRIDYASLNPFTHKGISDTVIIHTQKEDYEDSGIRLENTPETTAEGTEAYITPALNSISDMSPSPISEAIKTNETPALITSQHTQKKAKYHIVTGCFQIEENAIKFVETLSDQNMESAIIGKNKNNLFVVSSGGYNSYNQAIQALRTIQQTQPGAWLYIPN